MRVEVNMLVRTDVAVRVRVPPGRWQLLRTEKRVVQQWLPPSSCWRS